MKKMHWMILLVLVLTLALGASAFAQTTSVSYDGKTYVFAGDAPSFIADGKAFLVHEDYIQIKEAGKDDVFLPMESSKDIAAMSTRPAVPVGTTSAQMVEYAGTTSARQAEQAGATSAFAATISQAVETTVETVDSSVSVAISQAPLDAYTTQSGGYEDYEPYGLRYDSAQDALYYQGTRVRVFTDGYPLGDYGYCMIEHVDEAGTIDVVASRNLEAVTYNADGSYDPAGALIGLQVASPADFSARELTESTPGTMASAADSSGEPMSPAEKQLLYAPYADLGIQYNAAKDELTYQGQTVARLLDVKQSNGESLSGGKFKGTMTQMNQDNGSINVSILRDYTQPDAEGNGKIIGVSVEDVK